VADPNRQDLEVALALENPTERKLAVVSLIDQLAPPKKACPRRSSSSSESRNVRVEVRTSPRTSFTRSRRDFSTSDNSDCAQDSIQRMARRT